jgi:transposase InsO family protein
MRAANIVDVYQTPFYGSRRMTHWLGRAGHEVNRKRIQRLMRKMGLEAVYPRPRLSMAAPEHKVYPYLLRGIEVHHPDQGRTSRYLLPARPRFRKCHRPVPVPSAVFPMFSDLDILFLVHRTGPGTGPWRFLKARFPPAGPVLTGPRQANPSWGPRYWSDHIVFARLPCY